MQADFSLEDPLTFQEVIPVSQLVSGGRRRPPPKREGEEGVGAGSGEGPQQSAALLHEKVQVYMLCLRSTYVHSFGR